MANYQQGTFGQTAQTLYGRQQLHPFEVRADGWTSDSLTLERNGWRFQVEHEMSRDLYRIIIGKPGTSQMVILEALYMQQLREGARIPIVLKGSPFTEMQERTYAAHRDRGEGFHAVSMEDAYFCEREAFAGMRRVLPHDLFPQSSEEAAYADEEKQIVVPDQQTVDQLLDTILKKQAPQQKDIRQRARTKAKRSASIILLDEWKQQEAA